MENKRCVETKMLEEPKLESQEWLVPSPPRSRIRANCPAR